MFKTVNEGEEIVIFNMGRFDRIEGPGIVFLAPGLDIVHKTLDVREKQHDPTVRVFANGIPLTMQLHFRTRLDIRRAIHDRQRQIDVVTMDDYQREQQFHDTVSHAFTTTVKRYEREHPAPADADLFARIEHLVLGTPANDTIKTQLRAGLDRDLRSLGHLLNREAPCWIVIGQLPEGLGDALNRTRISQIENKRRLEVWAKMQEVIGTLPPPLRAHMMAVVEGFQPPPITIPSNDAANQTKYKIGPEGGFEVEIERGGSATIPPAASPPGPKAAAPPAPPDHPPSAPPAPTAGPSHPLPRPPSTSPAANPEPLLTADDVAQVRTVPQRPTGGRRAAS